jgi:periplasmic divalent cation tolerance protein
MTNYLLVMTTLPNVDTATRLAKQLLDARVAACVNILAPCTSIYRWQNAIETTTEVPLLIKTTQAAYPKLEALVLAEHPYELPEIIAVPLTVGLPKYLNWVDSETNFPKE